MAETTGDRRQLISSYKYVAMILFCLRFAVGWHMFYEGLAKLLTPNWTSAPYLELSRGICSGFFHWLYSSPHLLRTVDLLNIWGLILIGLALILGCFTHFASACGIVLLALCYLAQPPLIHTDPRIPLGGYYLLVDKNVIVSLLLAVFLFLPADRLWGLARLAQHRAEKREKAGAEPQTEKLNGRLAGFVTRRETLENLAAAPLLGVLGYTAGQKYTWEKVHAITGATIKLTDLSLNDLKGEMPQGTLGKLKISRLILGGNLMGGGSHGRDLIYLPSLMKAYNTDRKVLETLELAERAGINTSLLSTGNMPLFNKYRELASAKMQVICQVYMQKGFLEFLHHPVITAATVPDILTDIDRAIDYGVNAIYVNGSVAERFVELGRIDLLGKMLDHIKSQGYVAGLGAHSIEVPIQCEKAGLQPDYYVKTLHHDNYWSAHPRENRVEFSVDLAKLPDHNQFHDNIFDLFPEKTIEFMQTVRKPWIAFKVLAAGAIPPQDGFRFAFEHGADFICVGMFDFQIVEDVNIALDVLGAVKNRPRSWYA